MNTLTEDEVRAALAHLPGWSGDLTSIRAEYRFTSYEAGVAFAMQVALVAQRLDHHPDLLIGWQRVLVTFTSHDAGGVTKRDLRAAEAVAAFAPRTSGA